MDARRLAWFGLVVAACGGDSDMTAISIGLVAPLSGDLSVSGRDLQDSVRLAVEEINAGGGVLGRPFDLVVEDDGSSPEGATAAYGQLLAVRASVIVGVSHSAGVLALERTIRDGSTLTISGSATATAIARLDDGGYFFRTVPPDTVQANVLAEKVVEQAVQHLCLVHRKDLYGNGLATTLMSMLQSASVAVVEVAYNLTDELRDVMIACEPVRGQAHAGVLFITYQVDGREIFDDAAARGWSTATQKMFLVDGNRRQDLFDVLANRGAFEGAIGTSPSPPDPKTPEGAQVMGFRDRFEARYQRPAATFGESNYDATYLAAIAIEVAGSTDDPDLIRAAIDRTSTGAAVAADWPRIRAAIAADDQVDYRGASGDVNLDVATGELAPPYYMEVWSVVGGRIETKSIETVTKPPAL